MKKLILIITIITSSSCSQAGQVLWHTESGIQGKNDCVIDYQYTSDIETVYSTEISLSCTDQTINDSDSVPNGAVSFIQINENIVLKCPILFARVYSHDDFSILIDCDSSPRFSKNIQ